MSLLTHFFLLPHHLTRILDGGSADTTTGTIAGFLLNMVLHPEVQAKAQAQIDQVVGAERLPAFSE